MEESLNKWVAVLRFDPQTGAPGSELAVTCAAIVPWAITQAGDSNLPDAMAKQFAQLASGANELAAILRTLYMVSRAQLDRLVDQVVGTGVRGSHAVAQ